MPVSCRSLHQYELQEKNSGDEKFVISKPLCDHFWFERCGGPQGLPFFHSTG